MKTDFPRPASVASLVQRFFQQCCRSTSLVVLLCFCLWAEADILSFPHTSFHDHTNTFTDEETAWLHEHPVLAVGHSAALPPYSFEENGVLQGYWIDLLDLMFAGTGIEVVHQLRERYDGFGNLLNAGRFDVLSSLLVTAERQQQMLFSDAVLTTSYPVLATRINTMSIKHIDDLAGVRVSVIPGHPFTKKLLQHVPDVDLVEVETFVDALQALSYGQADASIVDLAMAAYWVRKRQIPNLKPVGPATLANMKDQVAAFAVAKDNRILQSIINKLLARVDASNLQQLRLRWSLSNPGLQLQEEAPLALSAADLAYVRQHQALRLCVAPGWMPYEDIDEGQGYRGIVADLIDEVARSIGLGLAMHYTSSWTEALQAIRDGQCDLLPAATPTESRDAWLDFSAPYLNFPLVLAVKSNQRYIDDIESLAVETLAVARGYAHGELMRQRYPDLNIIEVDTAEEGLRWVQSGEVFGFVDTAATIGYGIRTNNLFDLKIGGQLDASLQFSMAVRKGEFTRLLDIIERAAAAIPNSEKRALMDKWFPVQFDHGFDYSLVWKVALVSLMILLVVLFWNLKLARLNRKIAEAKQELETLSNTDQLTSLANRRCLELTMQFAHRCALETGAPMSLVLIDIDHFKSVNDEFGHDAGDRVLSEFGRLVADAVGETAMFGRWGGEEFMLVYPRTELDFAIAHAERLRDVIQKATYPMVGSITASFGAASFLAGDSPEDIFKRADNALYLAKQNGRNQVVAMDGINQVVNVFPRQQLA